MPGPVPPGVEIALRRPRIAAFTAARCGDLPCRRRQRLEDGVEPLHHGLFAADHQAIAALQPPDAATGADVEVMDALLVQRCGPADVVLPKGITAIDEGVARGHQT